MLHVIKKCAAQTAGNLQGRVNVTPRLAHVYAKPVGANMHVPHVCATQNAHLMESVILIPISVSATRDGLVRAVVPQVAILHAQPIWVMELVTKGLECASAWENILVMTAQAQFVALRVQKMRDPGVTLQLEHANAREIGQANHVTNPCVLGVPNVEDLSVVSVMLDRKNVSALDASKVMLARS